LKNIIFLDINIEESFRRLVEKLLQHDIGIENYFKEIGLILQNLALSYEWQELEILKGFIYKTALPLANQLNQTNARQVKSVVDRLKTCLGEAIDTF
jgi:hypothetical protein